MALGVNKPDQTGLPNTRYPHNLQVPIPIPIKTRTREHRYGFQVGVGAGTHRVTHGLPVMGPRIQHKDQTKLIIDQWLAYSKQTFSRQRKLHCRPMSYNSRLISFLIEAHVDWRISCCRTPKNPKKSLIRSGQFSYGPLLAILTQTMDQAFLNHKFRFFCRFLLF